jgi:hypothetical protein
MSGYWTGRKPPGRHFPVATDPSLRRADGSEGTGLTDDEIKNMTPERFQTLSNAEKFAVILTRDGRTAVDWNQGIFRAPDGHIYTDVELQTIWNTEIEGRP